MNPDRRATRRATALAVLSLWVSAPASAQTRTPPRGEPKWSLDVFGGAAMGTDGTGRGAARFPAGQPFVTVADSPSRANPSWFFGDGAALFNEVNREFASRFSIQFPRIEPLDSMLGAAALRNGTAATFGVRLRRRLTSRLDVELGIQRTQSRIDLRDDATAAIETARASFESGLRGLLNTAPVASLQVTSSVTLPDGANAPQTTVTGVVNIIVLNGSRFSAHLSAGAGHVTSSEATLTVPFRGSYQFRFLEAYPFDEKDNVTVRMTDDSDAFIGVFGGGITYAVGARHALRLDVRAHAGRTRTATSVDAAPVVAVGVPPLAVPSITTPAVQFSNTGAARSSLGGTISGLSTFSSDEIATRLLVTAGYSIRF